MTGFGLPHFASGGSPEARHIPLRRRRRATLSLALLATDLLVLVLTFANVHGPVRFVLGLIVALAVPGWSIVGTLRLENAALEAGLSIATSLSLLMVAAQLMMSLDLWHPVVLQELVCVVCAWPLYLQSRERYRDSDASR